VLIGIDASRALRAQRTGTERYALEIIRHLLSLPEAGEHQWRLYVDQPVALDHFGVADLTTIDRGLSGARRAPRGFSRIFIRSNPRKSAASAVYSKNFLELCHLPAQRLWTHGALAREVCRRRPDVLFVPAHVLPFVIPVWRLPASVVTVHDLGYRRFPAAHTHRQRWYLDWSTQWSALAATRLIAVSRATAADLTHFYATPQGKIDVIYEAAEPLAGPVATAAQVKSRYGLTRPYLLYVGTIQPRKNLARLLYAYAKLPANDRLPPDLVLAGGSGWLSGPLYQLATDLGLGERVRFLGYVPDADLPALYAGALAFCFPSLFEGFGLPVLEAQHYGVPVMTANNSALPEIAGDAALLVDPTDIDALADAMLRLSQDEALRQRLIAAGHENVKRFSWEKAARETLAVLLTAARTKRKPA
jgi:glycosyltransferase involved in cell wall biosynthesis